MDVREQVELDYARAHRRALVGLFCGVDPKTLHGIVRLRGGAAGAGGGESALPRPQDR